MTVNVLFSLFQKLMKLNMKKSTGQSYLKAHSTLLDGYPKHCQFFSRSFCPLGKRVGFSIRFSSFLLYSVQLCTAETIRGCVSLKKYESQGKTVEGTLNSKEDFCLDASPKTELLASSRSTLQWSSSV